MAPTARACTDGNCDAFRPRAAFTVRRPPQEFESAATLWHASFMSIGVLDHYARVAAELVRAVRGRRPRSQLSRKLNYSSNIVRRWEAGQCWPTAARFLTMCARLGVNLQGALSSFYGRTPAWLAGVELDTPHGVARFLSDLRGNTPIGALARTATVSRFSMARWLKGNAQPRLHEFLTSRRGCHGGRRDATHRPGGRRRW